MIKKWYNINEKNDNAIQPRSDFMNKIRTSPHLQNGYGVMDVDAYVHNYKTGNFMLFELKAKMAPVKFAQMQQIIKLDSSLRLTPLFKGVFLIQYKGLTMDDGNCISSLNKEKWDRIVIKDKDEFTEDEIFKFIHYVLSWREQKTHLL